MSETSAWERSVNYQEVIQSPSVRERIARQAQLADHPASMDDFYRAAASVVGMPALGNVAVASERGIRSVNSSLGINTSKVRTETFKFPGGRVLVAILCSLARRSMTIDTVRQAEDGCTVEARIPSNLISIVAGTLVVTVRRGRSGTSVEAATAFKGVLHTWGRQGRILRDLFADVSRFAAADVVA